jgi:hypothetical protein
VPLLACRALPFARMPATIAAGAMRLPTRRFLIGSALAAPLWGGAPLAIGYWMGDDVRALTAALDGATVALIWALPAGVLLLGMAWRARATPPHPLVLEAAIRRPAAYGVVPVVIGSSGWLLHSAQEPVKSRTFG